MSHVFLSHSRLDREIAIRVVHALESYGLVVWWDWKIDAGERWRRQIQEQLKFCSTVVVLWTPNSVTADAVIEEAAVGAKRSVLVPLLMQPCELPYGFGELNYIPLIHWEGARHDPEFQRVVSEIQRRIFGVTPLLTFEERKEILEDRRSRAFKTYTFELRGQSISVFVGDVRDDEGISCARASSARSASDNSEYLREVLSFHCGDKLLSELFDDQNQQTPITPVSDLEELAQAVVDRAVPSYRDQFNVG